MTRVEQLYDGPIRLLSAQERLRLLALLIQDISATLATPESVLATYGQAFDAELMPMTITRRLAQAGYHGGRLFTTIEDVDTSIREERDSWE